MYMTIELDKDILGLAILSKSGKHLTILSGSQLSKEDFLMAGDVNAHNPVWNSHCHRRQNAMILEDIIKQFGLLINNKPGWATRPSSRKV